jgi:hypothetical protein
MQILTFCPFFELQKAALGEMTFEGSNQLHIQKFQLGWKLDSQTFRKSLLLLHLDTWKCPKSGPKGARPVRQISPNFTVQLRKTQFDPV